MKVEEAKAIVMKKYPFAGYIDNSYANVNIATTVLRYLQPGSKILDFGAGHCLKTGIIQTLGFKCSACDDLQDDWHKLGDNRSKIMEFAKEMGVEFKLLTENALPFQEASFDMVMMHDVLEHLHDSPRELVNSLVKLIKPEGLLFITVPNAVNIRKRISVLLGKTNLPGFESYYWYPGPWRGHIREYVRDDLLKLSEYLGLFVVELRSCHHMLQKIPRPIRPVYVSFTALFPGWRDSWLLVAKKPFDWKPKMNLSKDELKRIYGHVSPYYSSM